MSRSFIKAASADRRFAVTIEAKPVEVMIKTSQMAMRNETGGILIGYIKADGSAVIREATGKPRGSRFTSWTFLRKNDGLKPLLKERWIRNEHYLGEWHSHPGGTSTPSEQDRATMVAIASDEAYQCLAPILVIVATQGREVRLSLTVFPRNESEVGLMPSD